MVHIAQMEFVNHPILGTITLDFCDSDGHPFDTIILAGENGSGKSTILRDIDNLEHNINNRVPFEHGRQTNIVFKLLPSELDTFESAIPRILVTPVNRANPEVTVRINYGVQGNFSPVTMTYLSTDDKQIDVHPNYLPGWFRSIFSQVETNFEPGTIQSVTSKDIDTEEMIASSALATDIAQLLVDIQTLDDGEVAFWVKEHPGEVPPADIVDHRLQRFKSAFALMFPHMQYSRVLNVSGTKKVIFRQRDKDVPLDDLSTGEKQIVFRGAFLLANRTVLNGSRVLVDEPEVSLHPSWQKQILEYYKRLLRHLDGTHTSQLIVATHSPFIIHNDNAVGDKVIVLERHAAGNIRTANNASFPNWTAETAVQQAFKVNLSSVQQPIIFVEGKTDEQYFRKAIDVFGMTHFPAEFRWIGQDTSHGGPDFTGDEALTHTKRFVLANPNILSCKVVLLYDSDVKRVNNEDHGDLVIRKVPFNEANTLYKKGSENLLTLSDDFPKNDFYIPKSYTDDYGAAQQTSSLDKTKLCDWICTVIPKEGQLKYLRQFEPVLNELAQLFNTPQRLLVP